MPSVGKDMNQWKLLHCIGMSINRQLGKAIWHYFLKMTFAYAFTRESTLMYRAQRKFTMWNKRQKQQRL